jgi:hypothetical protein
MDLPKRNLDGANRRLLFAIAKEGIKVVYVEI